MKNKKYSEIPIISHESEKPSIITEELSSGKIYPSIFNFEKSNIIEHNSEKPIIKEYIDNDQKEEISKKQLKKEKKSKDIKKKDEEIIQKENKKEKQGKKNKGKYKNIPIIAHESEKPHIVFEETNSGKTNTYLNASFVVDNKKDKEENVAQDVKKKKKSPKNKKLDDKVPIVEHDSEKPSIVFEEINSGKSNECIQTSITNYNYKENKKPKNKKEIKKSNIKVHESEKPSFVCEEINAGKLYSNIQTSKTDKNLKNLSKCDESKIITSHESQKPTVVFEEANTGILLSFQHNI